MPPMRLLILSMLLSAACAVMAQAWAAGRINSLPLPGSVPQQGPTDLAVGPDWTRLSTRCFWSEAHSIELGRRAALVQYPPNAPRPPLFPAHLRSVGEEQSRSFNTGRSQIVLRASGWPLRTWVEARARPSLARPWITTHRVRWLALLTVVVGAAALGALAATIARAPYRLAVARSRRRSARCVTCGYDLRGLSTSGACPECGSHPA